MLTSGCARISFLVNVLYFTLDPCKQCVDSGFHRAQLILHRARSLLGASHVLERLQIGQYESCAMGGRVDGPSRVQHHPSRFQILSDLPSLECRQMICSWVTVGFQLKRGETDLVGESNRALMPAYLRRLPHQSLGGMGGSYRPSEVIPNRWARTTSGCPGSFLM